MKTLNFIKRKCSKGWQVLTRWLVGRLGSSQLVGQIRRQVGLQGCVMSPRNSFWWVPRESYPDPGLLSQVPASSNGLSQQRVNRHKTQSVGPEARVMQGSSLKKKNSKLQILNYVRK